jgi:hypothetical protein
MSSRRPWNSSTSPSWSGIASDDRGGAREVVGVGRLNRQRGGRDAEFALVVSDAWQKRGLHKRHDLCRKVGIGEMHVGFDLDAGGVLDFEQIILAGLDHQHVSGLQLGLRGRAQRAVVAENAQHIQPEFLA